MKRRGGRPQYWQHDSAPSRLGRDKLQQYRDLDHDKILGFFSEFLGKSSGLSISFLIPWAKSEMILVISNQMNLALGVLFTFLGWAFLAYVGCQFLLSLYDGGRYPVEDISEADRKANAVLRNKYSIVGGLVGGMLFLFLRYGIAL